MLSTSNELLRRLLLISWHNSCARKKIPSQFKILRAEWKRHQAITEFASEGWITTWCPWLGSFTSIFYVDSLVCITSFQPEKMMRGGWAIQCQKGLLCIERYWIKKLTWFIKERNFCYYTSQPLATTTSHKSTPSKGIPRLPATQACGTTASFSLNSKRGSQMSTYRKVVQLEWSDRHTTFEYIQHVSLNNSVKNWGVICKKKITDTELQII